VLPYAGNPLPERIDLGIGARPVPIRSRPRAPGRAGEARLLGTAPSLSPPFPEKVAEVIGFLRASLPAEHPFARVVAMPSGSGIPEVWLLGSSDESAMLAAHLGPRSRSRTSSATRAA